MAMGAQVMSGGVDITGLVSAATLRRWQDPKFSSEFDSNPQKALGAVARELGLRIKATDLAGLDALIAESPVGVLADGLGETDTSVWTSDCGRYWTATVECLCGPTETGRCECAW